MFVGDGETSERKTKDEKKFAKFVTGHTHTQVLVGFVSFICAISMMYACGGEPGDVEMNPTDESLTPRSLPSPGDPPPEEESIDQTSFDSNTDPSQTPFIHPLKAWDASRGVLFRDVRDDEDGKRYAVGDSVRSYGNGAVVTSGIRTLEREAISEEELRELVEQGRRHRPAATKSEKIGPVLAKWLQEAGPEDQEPILVHFHRPAGFESHIYRMHHAISSGRIQT